MPPLHVILLVTTALARTASAAALVTTTAPRRAVLAQAAAIAIAMPSAANADLPEAMVDIPVKDFRKVPGGVGGQLADISIGQGAEATEGSKVSLQWVLRRSNGYYVDGSVKMLSAKSGAVKVGDNFDEANNFNFVIGDGKAMPGVDQGVRGMRQGGKRRLVLPMKAAYTLPIDKSPGPLPDEYGPRRQIERELQRQDPYNYFSLEVELVRLR
mmetsp:Transcript_50033/g.99675  ORF Transcript_50033/g.99675 Transcript_50033/m.99675 type:complete len:213 (-) Transcript_50033:43-681(-)